MKELDTYSYSDLKTPQAHDYIAPKIFPILDSFKFDEDRHIFDLGRGNGSFAARLEEEGYTVTGVDPSREGIRRANEAYPDLNLHQASAYDEIKSHFLCKSALREVRLSSHRWLPFG
jgi:2-polyprenyl-6-hydroxyphenyl methylase/3-demethylubiquinone-9 3-methyltransferase